MAEVDFRHVDVVFGPDPGTALKLLDEGESREIILEETGHVLGVADSTIAIEPGEICVLMGLSGSGKSTLLRCVNRLNKATRGAVLVDDPGGPVDVATCDQATLRRLRTRRIAMVFQQFGLLPWRTVQENVGFGLELRGMNRAERDRVVDEKLKLSTSTSGGTSTRTSFRAACSSASASPAPSRPMPTSCSWTSRSPRWIR